MDRAISALPQPQRDNPGCAEHKVLLSAVSMKSEYDIQTGIYFPSFLALSIISAMRSNSSGVRRREETSKSEATTCSGRNAARKGGGRLERPGPTTENSPGSGGQTYNCR